MGGVTAPEICVLKRNTGIPCPGCGLTRSWVLIAQGQIGASLHRHRLGLALMVFVMLQAARHAVFILVESPSRSLVKSGRWLDRAAIPLAGAMLINWVVGLL